jgi:hypothetical protein
MHCYRLYFFSARTGHIDRFAEFEAPDDHAARALATEHEGANPLELWCGHRRIARIEPNDGLSQILSRWRASHAAAAQRRSQARLEGASPHS